MSANNELILSQKYNNYDYAPGIATYGIDGKTGKTGENGNNIYFTDYDILNSKLNLDLKEILSKIMSNELPLVGLNIKITRPYKEGDLFFDKNGIILKLKTVEYSISEIINDYTNYFEIVGKLNAQNEDDQYSLKYFEFITNNRLALNTNNYKGFDILSGININDPSTYEDYIDKESVINIVSNVINENDNIDMIRLQSIDDIDIEDGQLTLAYKTTDNAFYVNSNKPIVINSDLKVDSSNNVNFEYDNFSTVLTSDDTITYFKYLCDKLKYSIIYDDLINQYVLSIYLDDSEKDALTYLVNRKDTVFGKIYTGTNDLILMKLSNVINGFVNLDSYDMYLPAYNILELLPTFTKSGFNIEYINVRDSSIYVNCIENTYNKSLSINVSVNVELETLEDEQNIIIPSDITPQYYEQQLMNNIFGVKISYNKNIYTYKLSDQGVIGIDMSKKVKTSYVYSENGQYKFTFDTKDIKRTGDNKYINFDIIPLIDYNGGTPVQISFKVPNDLNGSYTMYFTIVHSNSKFSITNIMLDNENGIKFYNNDIRPCIQSYIPNNVDSVKRFSLMHNTEIFIDYWNEIPKDSSYNTLGEINPNNYVYRLTGYNPYIYNQSLALVPLDKDYYEYSGQTVMFDNLLCYVWDRYENGIKSDATIGMEYQILTNTLDIALPLTIDSPEYVASIDGTDEDYNTLKVKNEANRDVDYENNEFINKVPQEYRGLQVLLKIKNINV